MLIHNGGSIFHDFQIPMDKNLKSHSYPIGKLLESYDCNKLASLAVWMWAMSSPSARIAPEGSITRLCENINVPVLLFTTPGCDFWHMFSDNWRTLADESWRSFTAIASRFSGKGFHFVNMGSAVMHPEVFIKAIAKAKPAKGSFKADVVDFKEMYRPRTRVAIFGEYFKMTHQEYFTRVM